MVWILVMMALLPISARAADLVIPAESARVEIRDVKFYRIAYGFQEDEKTGSFQLQVNVRYRKWTSHIEQVKHYTFRLQSGAIVQCDDRTLVLRLDNREVTVGRHRWWYSPYWQPADKVRIACDRDQGIRHLVIENCRLIVKNQTLNETKATAAFVGLPMPDADTESVSWLLREHCCRTQMTAVGYWQNNASIDLVGVRVAQTPFIHLDRSRWPSGPMLQRRVATRPEEFRVGWLVSRQQYLLGCRNA